uniref:HECT-type E3 ubiquitin transferase n=1 Tax=Bionectria ochroleuca TaxID=29856 RepID=A0A8H7TPX7_BIOOC
MFSTFTGNSRRPRNVNLSGQTGNPFTNTSWSPSNVSNATKAVSDAQADREKRQAERQRLKAASTIQRVWKGHQERRQVCELRRRSFDSIYGAGQNNSDISNTLPVAFSLLISFFSHRRKDDVTRLVRFVRNCSKARLEDIVPPDVHPSRVSLFVRALVDALKVIVIDKNWPEILEVLSLSNRILQQLPDAVHGSVESYYTALASICQLTDGESTVLPILVDAFSAPLRAESNQDLKEKAYRAIYLNFLTRQNILIFEANIAAFSVDLDRKCLASTIINGYLGVFRSASNSELLWLLSHYIAISQSSINSTDEFLCLEALDTQLSVLMAEINSRLDLRVSQDQSTDDEASNPAAQPLEPYVKNTLLLLVSQGAITNLLRNLTDTLVDSSDAQLRKGSVFGSYISTLLLCFPGQADDVRMRLFLGSVPTPEGDTPTVKFLWNKVKSSTLLNNVITESQLPIHLLRNYAVGNPHSTNSSEEEQEWRIILIFLEIYIFVLRLSDDDDFIRAMHPHRFSNADTSRIQACGLRIEDLERLTTFLKKTAFSLYYHSHQIFNTASELELFANSRLGSYLEGSASISKGADAAPSSGILAKSDVNRLKDIVTTTMKMLYERDSRQHFLPINHWLMTDKLDSEDFVTAVIAEDERQAQEGEEESDEDSEEAALDAQFGPTFDFRGMSRFANSRVSHNARLERLRIKQKRLQRERRLAIIGPKLEVLKHMPFVVPFETRVNLFRQFINLDRIRRDGANLATQFGFANAPFARHQANIRRGQLFEDAYEEFYKLGEGLKDPISITFVDQFGTPEAGIDGGGVTKEFLISVTTEAFSNTEGELGMFTSNNRELLYPNPTAVDNVRELQRQAGLGEYDPEMRDALAKLLRRYEFLGRIIGKCLYEGILVDLAFAGFFLLQWPSAGSNEGNTYKGSINDLRDMDESLYNGLLQLKNQSGDVSELGFDFTITDQVSLPGQPLKTVTRNLVPNGDKTQVTNDNRLLYISYVARHRLVVQPAQQTAAFLRGLRTIIRPSWLSMFNQSELQRLVGGDSSEIDIEDLRRNTVYSGLYEIGDDKQEHPTIKLFWKVMKGFTDAQRRDVLKYVSSTPRAPLLGFSQLRPKFSIRDGGRDEKRLPSTSTCVNLLKLPQYKTEAKMREKLLYAITSGAGFDLS